MQNINGELYRTNFFYRDLVDKMLANEKEQKIRQLELEQQIRQRQVECERLQAELDFRRRRVFGYANQIPYQSMTPISQTQYKSSYTDMQNNFVLYWSAPVQKLPAKPQLTAEQQEQIRRVFHSAVSTAAHFSKPSAPSCHARLRWTWHHDGRQFAGCRKNCCIDCGYHRSVNRRRFEEPSEQRKR